MATKDVFMFSDQILNVGIKKTREERFGDIKGIHRVLFGPFGFIVPTFISFGFPIFRY